MARLTTFREKVGHEIRDLVDLLIECEMACIEQIDLRERQIALIRGGCGREKREVIAPHMRRGGDWRARIHPCLPFPVGGDIRTIVVQQCGLNLRLPRTIEKRIFVGQVSGL
jgi:hypothetical protein